MAATKLPEIFAYPVMLAPVPVTVIVVLPTAEIVTLPLAVPIFTLLLPLLILEELIDTNDRLPEPSV